MKTDSIPTLLPLSKLQNTPSTKNNSHLSQKLQETYSNLQNYYTFIFRTSYTSFHNVKQMRSTGKISYHPTQCRKLPYLENQYHLLALIAELQLGHY